MIPRGGGGDRGGDVGRRLRGEEERKGEEGADVWARFARERGAAGARGRAVSGRKWQGAVGWAGVPARRGTRAGRLSGVRGAGSWAPGVGRVGRAVGFPGQFGLSLAGLGLGFSFLYFLFSLFFFFSFLLFQTNSNHTQTI